MISREERIASEQECARLVARYANLNDAGDFDAVARLYASHGRMTRPSAPEDWIEGRDAILAAFKARPSRTTRHLCTNVEIEIIDDTKARGVCAIALFLSNEDVRVGTYHDLFERTSDGWRFAERRGSMTF